MVKATKGEVRRNTLGQINFRKKCHREEDFESKVLKTICDHIPTGTFTYSSVCRPCPRSLHSFLLPSPTFLCSSSLSADDLASYFTEKPGQANNNKTLLQTPKPHNYSYEAYIPIYVLVFVLMINCMFFHVRPSPLMVNQFLPLSPIQGILLSKVVFFLSLYHFSYFHLII